MVRCLAENLNTTNCTFWVRSQKRSRSRTLCWLNLTHLFWFLPNPQPTGQRSDTHSSVFSRITIMFFSDQNYFGSSCILRVPIYNVYIGSSEWLSNLSSFSITGVYASFILCALRVLRPRNIGLNAHKCYGHASSNLLFRCLDLDMQLEKWMDWVGLEGLGISIIQELVGIDFVVDF